QGYYSYDLGAWHIVVLNTGSSSLVPFTATSPQVQWLKADLAAHPARCTLAYWHNPLFDSKDAPNTAVRPLWDALYAAGADVVVNAHYAFYERFAPQTPAGLADPVTPAATFTDPDAADAPWAYTVGWGDGSSSTGTATSPATPIGATHSYAAVGTYKVDVRVTNGEGRTGADTLVVTVVAPSVLVGAGDIADCAKTGDSLTANLMD